MIFFCFSSKDRYTVVEPIFFHVKNFGFDVWYDRHDIVLGDNRNYVNFVEGVENNKFAIIILSQNTINSICANEEIDLIKAKYEKGEMTVFPLYYKLKAEELPEQYEWLNTMVYKELDDSTGTLSACNHIFTKVLKSTITHKYKNLSTFANYYSTLEERDEYIEHLLTSYFIIDEKNYNARITILYAIYSYINYTYKTPSTPIYCTKGFERTFSLTKLNIDLDLREILYCEYLLLICLDVVINNSDDDVC